MAARSLGWWMTKWMAGLRPLDTMAHLPRCICISRVRKVWLAERVAV